MGVPCPRMGRLCVCSFFIVIVIGLAVATRTCSSNCSRSSTTSQPLVQGAFSN